MRNILKVALPILVIFIAASCSSAKLSNLENTFKKNHNTHKEMLEQIDRDAANINEALNDIAQANQRLKDIENRINTSQTDDTATIQELRENLAFLSDQLSRLDKSVQSRRPRPIPPGASVFKPGGFNVNSSYQAAFSDYNAKRYEAAISGFTELLTVAPQSSLADNAQYWIGECYDAMGNYDNALAAFDKVFDYSDSNKLPDAHVKVGLIYAKMGKSDAAKEELQAVITNYPGTNAAKIATAKIKTLGE